MHRLGEAFKRRASILVSGQLKGEAQNEWGRLTDDDTEIIERRTAPTQRAHPG
jgi:hypothetical protein